MTGPPRLGTRLRGKDERSPHRDLTPEAWPDFSETISKPFPTLNENIPVRRVLTIEAFPELPSGRLLLQMALTLSRLNVNPNALQWITSFPGNIIRVRMILSREEQSLMPDIAESMRQLPGVREVKLTSDPFSSDQPHLQDW